MTSNKLNSTANIPSITNSTDPRDAQLLARVQALLAGHLPPGVTLERSEVNAGVAATAGGYLYLRFVVPTGAPVEFWAHWGPRDHVGDKSGQVSVKAPGSGTTA
ncbi:hypothetical protein HNQ07_004724 [Deinococcus metalli]|uniref:Uncharacterized protein n=1 Tax=Deinococcus metalli TaxID=1141878 RepID=A0A7W8KJ91_9DEIO|nr:hypothetical protein [Deinococcus metalli]MBB5379209.1 hypothetical protein [Deinococcus metalli]GHF65434.1 hypothetical protein GCM10017781_46400 [Deinococcus metalli]